MLQNGRQTGRRCAAAQAHSRLFTALGCRSTGRPKTINDKSWHRERSLLGTGDQKRNTTCRLTHTPACVKASDSGKHREAAGWTTDVPEEGICAAAQPARRCFGLPKKWTTQQHQRRVQALTRTSAVSKRQEALKHLSHHARRTTTGTSSPLAGTLTEAAVWQ